MKIVYLLVELSHYFVISIEIYPHNIDHTAAEPSQIRQHETEQ